MDLYDEVPEQPWAPEPFAPRVAPATLQADGSERINARVIVQSGQVVLPDRPIGPPRGPSTTVVAFTMPLPDPFSNGGPFSSGGQPAYHKLPLVPTLGLGADQGHDELPINPVSRQWRPESYPWDEDLMIGGPTHG